MTAQATDTSVHTSIVVEAPIERAFSVFTDDIDSWWDPDHHIIEAEFAEMVSSHVWAVTCTTAAWTEASVTGHAYSSSSLRTDL